MFPTEVKLEWANALKPSGKMRTPGGERFNYILQKVITKSTFSWEKDTTNSCVFVPWAEADPLSFLTQVCMESVFNVYSFVSSRIKIRVTGTWS